MPAVFLIHETVPLRFRDGSLPKGVDTVGLDITIVRRWPQTVERQQARGHEVYVWTVDRPEDVRLCLSSVWTPSSATVRVRWSTR